VNKNLKAANINTTRYSHHYENVPGPSLRNCEYK